MQQKEGAQIIQIGKVNKLRISNFTDFGAYLDAETGNRQDNVLLPGKQVPENTQKGDYLDVFIYKDSENRLIATTRQPLAVVGDLAYLKVTAKTKIGAFIDIGLERGLFLPFSEQKYNLEVGKSYLVYVYVDKSNRLSCTTDIYKYLQTGAPFKKDDKVNGTVYGTKPEFGAFVAVENKYFGLIPKSEYYTDLKPGDTIEARVLRVRDDGKLDLSPRELAYRQMDKDGTLILKFMEANDGCLPIAETASPQEIADRFGMSKAAFKRAVGGLLKSKRITKTDSGFRLK